MPYIWIFLSKILRRFAAPIYFPKVDEVEKIQTAYLFVSDMDEKKRRKVPGIDLTASLESWLSEVKIIQNIAYVSDVNEINSVPDNSVAAFSYDWISKEGNWARFCYEIWRTGIYLRKKNIPAWVFVADVFAQEHAFPISLLVALAGGAIIVQPNSSKEAKVFGLVHPVGPLIWTITPSIVKKYSSDTPWNLRRNVALIANSGEPRRFKDMASLRNKLELIDFKIQTSDRNLSWANYLQLIGNVKIVATTSWVQVEHKIGPKKLRERIPETNVTHRVWDGFASGAVVITNNCLAFQELEIFPGIHFIELSDIISNKSEIPESEIMKEIAKNGRLRFQEIVMDRN